MIDIKIRKGVEADLDQVLALVKELAIYEKAPNEVEVTLAEMHNWGFGNDRVFEFFVAEHEHKIIGIALYYYKYSTWKGKCLFLEDIIVTEAYRRYGLGSKLFNEVALVAKQQQVRRMEWQVLDWNEPAINFYKKYNAHLDGEWINGKLTHQQLQSF
ncbi:MAG TPA: GNAT family N-acetyltransferase [Bacteroidia bacterium]|nr:GNAT family N-acetyltransferase [Bacteroidia bacterium]